jgi:nucleoside-diphosphate-sugar epimerase
MRIVVTGGSGLVGRAIVRQLAARHNVLSFDIIDPGDAGVDLSPAAHLRGDVRDLDAVTGALEEAHAVVHAAALPGPSFGSPAEIHDVNVEGTKNVAAAARRAGVGRIVFISSDSVLGFVFSAGAVTPRFLPVDESHPLSPIDPYGRSKLDAELALARQRGNATVVSLRPPWVWVPEEYDKVRHLTETPSEWSGGLWAYVHVDDLARAVELAATADVEPGCHAVYVAAPDNGTTVPSDELAREYFPGATVRGELPEFGSLLSSGALERLLGFRPSMMWREFLS